MKPQLSPFPHAQPETIHLAHGSGGRLSAELIASIFLPQLGNPVLNRLEDQAVLVCAGGRLAVSTDAFVVDPLFFPGGDIGDLAVNGTVNDVAMAGATPLWLTAAFIIEEGLPLADLRRVVASMARAAAAAGVSVVTGDTKVVQRGGCDKLFISTTGIGLVPEGLALSAASLTPGDAVILSGSIGDHGMAILTCREGLSFESRLHSDTAALHGLVAAMLEEGATIRVMRDPTRGGLAASLNELAAASGVGIEILEAAIPVKPETRAVCELLGIDPLAVANEGKLVTVVAAADAGRVLAAMRKHPLGRDAALIGEVCADHPGMVTMRTPLGTRRIVELPMAEQLPRIC